MKGAPGAPSRPGADWEALARAATGSPEPVGDRDVRPLLVVALGRDLYGLPVDRVREIVRPRPVTPVPHAPVYVKGVISLRGDVLQVLDLGGCLGLPETGDAASARRSRIVVLRGEDGPCAALQVGGVVEVWRMQEEQIQAAPGGGPEAVTGLGIREGRFVSLVDVDRILEAIHGA